MGSYGLVPSKGDISGSEKLIKIGGGEVGPWPSPKSKAEVAIF